jgi:hypothetical protein
MITPSHIIYGWALGKATEKSPDKPRTLAFVIGSFLPDIPVYVFFFVHTFLLGTSQQLMWDELYFDSAWSPVITLSHSLLMWPILLLGATFFKHKLLQYISAAALLHVVMDFFVHHDDAYRHFWPVSDWKFYSPLSYWDPAYYGTWVGAIDAVAIILLLAWLGSTYKNNRKIQYTAWSLIGLYVCMQAVPLFIF